MISATLFAKALGLLRSMILAWTLGDSAEAVAFAAASKIPGALFDFLFSAAILACFIPEYNRTKTENEEKARAFSSAFLGAALLAAAVLALLGIVFAPQIIAVSAPKISKDTAELAARLLRIMFPMTVFAAGAYTLTGILQSAGSFLLPASVSAVSNAFMVAYLVLAGKNFSVCTLAAVYVFSWFLQFLTLAVPLIIKKQMPVPRLDFRQKNLRAAAKNAPQIMAGSWLSPALVLFAAFFSSFVSDTAFVVYDYASGIYTIISGVAVYGVGNFVFPNLSRLFAGGERKIFEKSAQNAVFSIMLIIAPVFAAAFSLSYEGVALLYLRGNFTQELAHACARSLSALALAMPACALSEILYRVFYAAGKPRAPMFATLSAMCVCVLCNLLSLFAGAGILGVSLSFTAAVWAHALALFFAAKKSFPDMFGAAEAKKGAKLLLSGAVCTAAMLIFQKIFPLFSTIPQTIAIFLKIAIVFIVGIVLYLICIYIMGFCNPKKHEKR